MRVANLTDQDRKLVERARRLIQKRKSNTSSVAAVLRTDNNRIFSGVNIDVDVAPCSMCAEYAAIGTMVAEGEKKIETIVAVATRGKKEYTVIPPCGKCRQFISEFGNPHVVVLANHDLKKVRLEELNPLPC